VLVAVLVVAAAGSGAAAGARSPAQVVREWSRDLNANRNAAAARLFAPGARVVQGQIDVRLTPRLALAFNASLPCAGRIVRMQVRGEAVVATFVLGERPKHRCDGPGEKAAALFVVRNGRIVMWEQVAVPPAKKPSAPPA
jgi:limonene-1,2-epoxide hydrolase